jgi:hypothetical protein
VLLNNYTNAIETWYNAGSQTLELAKSGETDQATQLIKNTNTPALIAMEEYGEQLETALLNAQETAIQSEWSGVRTSIMVAIVVIVLLGIVVILLAVKIIKSIIGPTEEVQKALVGFSEGKLDVPVEYEANNELGQMCDALRRSQKILGGVIDDVSRLLQEMANGNFDVRTKDERMYVGDMARMLQAIRGINRDQPSRPAWSKNCPPPSPRSPTAPRRTPRRARRPCTRPSPPASRSPRALPICRRWWRPWIGSPRPLRRSARSSPPSRISPSRPTSWP